MTATRTFVSRFGAYECILYAIDTLGYGLIQHFKTSVLLPIWMKFLEGSVSYRVKNLTAKVTVTEYTEVHVMISG